MMKKSWVLVLAVHFLCSLSHANFVLKLTTDDPTTLNVGQTATLEVWGWVDDATATGGNGLWGWQFDAITDVTGVIQINQVNTPLQPAPVDNDYDIWGENDGTTGSFSALAFIEDGQTNSSTGVGDYDQLITFQIEAIGTGTAQYSLTGIVGELMDYTVFRTSTGTADFHVEGSDNVITVVPEPSSMLILSGLSLIGYLRRKRG